MCRSGENSHRIPITRDAIKDAAPTLKGVPLLAEFTYDNQDFHGHGTQLPEQCCGFFEEVEPELVEKDDELYIKGRAKLWRDYFPHAVDILKRKNGETPMSMEMQCLDYREPTPTEDGIVNKFKFLGVTLLSVKPAIKGSKATVLSFSEMQDEYNKETQTDLEQFSNSRKEVMAQSYKVNTTELKTTPWGDISKTELRNKVMSATNRASLVKKVYALVESGWQTAPSEHLKYPLMQLVGDTFYYNRGALASALAYAKQENEQSVINKVESLYRKFNLNMEDEMADIKEKDMTADIIEAEEQKPEEQMAEESKDGEKFEEPKEGEQPEEPETDMAEEPKEPEEPEDGDEGDEGDDDADQFAESIPFAQALMQLMDCASADERMACRETMSYSEDENIVMDRICAGCKEMAELREFKAECLAEKTECGVAEILASVKQSLSQEDFAELEEKSKEVKFETLDMFKMQAKAFAFEHMSVEAKEAHEDEVIRMGVVQNENTKPKNVFERILGK